MDNVSGDNLSRVTSLSLPTDKNDIIHGNNHNNILRGGGGDNTIYGYDGDDELHDATLGYGGNGNDTFYRGHTLFGEAGNDAFYGGRNIDGGAGMDVLHLNGQSLDHVISDNGDGSFTVTDMRDDAPNGVILLRQIETVQFSDQAVSL